MTPTALPDVLRKAADIIGERGWTRGTDVHPEDGSVCANGALRLACGSTVVPTEPEGFYRIVIPRETDVAVLGKLMSNAHRVLDNVLDEPIPEAAAFEMFSMPKVIAFNDKVAKSGAEVQAIFHKAADYLESHPLSVLAQVEDQPVPFTITPAGTAALDIKDLVLA